MKVLVVNIVVMFLGSMLPQYMALFVSFHFVLFVSFCLCVQKIISLHAA